MEIEIFLDCAEVEAEDRAVVMQKFMEWYNEGAEVRCNKLPFSSMSALSAPNRYLVDLGYADVISSLRNLHARIRRFGVKVFFHFT